MKNVTSLFKASCNSDVVQSLFKIFVYNKLGGGLYATLDGDDFFEDSLTITSQATSSSSFNIGGVCAGKLTLTLTRAGVSKLKTASALRKGMCWKVVQWNKVADSAQSTTDFSKNTDGSDNTSGRCNLGVFYVSGVENNDYSCGITAYDGMLAFDKTVTAVNNQYMQQNKKTVAGWIDWICSICVTGNYNFGHGVASGLPNRGMSFALSDDKTVSTYRDALGYLSILSGGFCTFDENGKFVIKDYSYTPVSLGMSHKRLLSGKFDDKVSEITAVYSSVAGFDFERSSTGSSDKNSVEISISENPFIRGLQSYNKTEMDSSVLTTLNNLADAIIMKEFYGCDCTLSAYPFIDIGDCISVDRVVVAQNGSSTDVVETNIVVSQITYSAGSSVNIKSNSTSGSSTSVSSGSRTSQPKESSSSASDNRVDDLINGMTKYKYTTKTVKIPLTYVNDLDGGLPAELGTPIKQTGLTIYADYDIKTESHLQRKDIRTEALDIKIPDNAFHTAFVEDDTGQGYSDGLDFYTTRVNLGSYITDVEENISDVRVYADFSKTRRMCFLTMYNPALGGDWSNPQYGCDCFGDLDIVYKTPFVFNGYAYQSIRSMMEFEFSGDFRVFDVYNNRTEYRGDVLGQQHALGIKPDFLYTARNTSDPVSFMYEGDTPKAPIFDMRFGTVDEMRNSLDTEAFYFSYKPSDYDYVGREGTALVTTTEFFDPSMNKPPETSRTHSNLWNWRYNLLQTLAVEMNFGTYTDYVTTWTDADGNPGYFYNLHGYYTNLPENILLTYTVKEEVPDDINGVIDSINDNENGIEELRADVSELKKLTTLTGYNVQNNTAEIETIKTRLDTLESRVDSIDINMTKVKTTLADHEARLVALEFGIYVTDIWFEDENGNRLPDNFQLDGVWYSDYNYSHELYSCISILKLRSDATDPTNQFYIKYGQEESDKWEYLGKASTSKKSKDTFYPTTDSVYSIKAECIIGDVVIKSKELRISGYESISAAVDYTGDGQVKNVKVTPSGGAPTKNISAYKYKFTYGSYSSADSDDKVLMDWSASPTIDVAVGSSAVDGETSFYVHGYVSDGWVEDDESVYLSYDGLMISDNWFQRSVDGARLPDLLHKDGVWYSPYNGDYMYLYIGATSNVEGASKSFYSKEYGSDDTSYFQVGSTVTGDVSDDSINATSGGYTQRDVYKTVVTDGTSTVETTMQLAGYPSLGGSLEQLSQSGNTYTFKASSDSGLPSVGISEYKYKFRWYDPESSTYYVLQDYSTKDTVSFTLGSDAVGGSTRGYLYLDIKDGYETNEDAMDVSLGY